MSYYENKFPDWKQKVIDASQKAKSATEAAAILGIKYDTYRAYAKKYGCFITNQSGKGLHKLSNKKIPIEDIIYEGLHPQYQSNKLRIRLLEENIFEHKCYSCNHNEWLGVPIPLELEHIDGNPSNNLKENLTLLCPNCHALTDTYRGKNSRKV